MAAERSDVDNYDVFINFRGADTRHGFAYRLYDALVAEGIRVFVDEEELNKGRRLDEELPQAINNSKIYITVISEKYASSKWCLRELTEIVRNKQEFKDKKEILPVFYKIKAEDVKLRTDLFTNQLESLKEKVKSDESVEEWGEALKGIPNLKAWTVPIDGGYKQEGECCREIVKRVSIILRVKHKPLPKDLIGMKDPVEEVMQLLHIGSPGFRVIGIHGMGGSGKTTLAKAVYNELCDDKFDCCCFLPDVRESLDKGSVGCLELQKKLLKEVSYRGDVDAIRDIDEAVRRIQRTLQGKKVLMVFDDVSKADQMVKLIGNVNSIIFGGGSLVIITTRDDRVLRNREFKEFTKIHEMKAMENEHALELFSWHAFGKPMPPKDYIELSKDAVRLTGRLPLSLEITGSLFFIGGRMNWEQTVEKLQKMPNEDVQERLKISYEDLEERTKEIFLDIACFFVEKEPSDEEIAMWDSCGFFPRLAIEELISMCLIKIEETEELWIEGGHKYWMHDHIKDLGREIVRQEGPKEKEQRSRIWNKLDALDILTGASGKKENNKIEAILLGNHTYGDRILLTLRGEKHVHLKRLRFLHFESSFAQVQLKGSFEHVFPNLIWLSWPEMKVELFNATNFSLKKLVILNLSLSNITESWGGWKKLKDLPCLTILNLSHCDGLKKTPDLSYYTSLKKLLLSHCYNLEEIDGSITSLQKLQHLDLSYCEKLKKFPDSIGELVELEVLLLLGCSCLVSLPNSFTSLPKLHSLNVSHCTSLESLTDSVGEMTQLTEIDISHSALKKLPRFISKQKKLQVLRADGTEMQEDGVSTEIEESTCLREIYFGCLRIIRLPSLVKLTHLEKLSLSSCNRLEQLPTTLPTSLVELHVSSFSLQSIPDYSYLTNLTDLGLCLNKCEAGEPQELNVNWIWRLSKLKKLLLSLSATNFTTTIQSEESSSVIRLSQLEELTLRCSVLGTCVIPSFLSSALRKLDISMSKRTASLSLPRLNRLTLFNLSRSDDLEQIGLGELESLISLRISSCHSLESLDDISKLRQLVTLNIRDCQKLRVISVAPCLRSLKELELFRCNSLESLVGPSEESESCLDSLHLVEHLKIGNCPLLKNQLPSEFLEITKGKFVQRESEQHWNWFEEEDEAGPSCFMDDDDDDDDDDDGEDVEEKDDDDEAGPPNTLCFMVEEEEEEVVVVEEEVVVVKEEADDVPGSPNTLRFMGFLALLGFSFCLGFTAGSWRRRRFLH